MYINTSLRAQNAEAIFTDTIPLGGNAWVNKPANITDEGLTQWNDAASVTSIYFRADVAQTFNLFLRAKVNSGKSEISITSNNNKFIKQISNTNFSIIEIGKLNISKPGYIKIDLKGINKTGNIFAHIS